MVFQIFSVRIEIKVKKRKTSVGNREYTIQAEDVLDQNLVRAYIYFLKN